MEADALDRKWVLSEINRLQQGGKLDAQSIINASYNNGSQKTFNEMGSVVSSRLLG